jgi:hypothetical protein
MSLTIRHIEDEDESGTLDFSKMQVTKEPPLKPKSLMQEAQVTIEKLCEQRQKLSDLLSELKPHVGIFNQKRITDLLREIYED